MRLAILIQREAYYRLLGPLVEAAFARGWSVECWHDYGQGRSGFKGYQFPAVEAVPRFRNGTPVIKTHHGAAELRTWLTEMRADAIVTVGVNAFEMPLPTPRPLVVCHQYFLDSLVWEGPKSALAWDLLTLHSRWWLDWSADLFEAEGAPGGRAAFLREISERSAFVGLPELDVVSQIDPDEVRHRWGIAPGRPVVVLFPFPQGVGRNTFWPQRICAEPSRVKQAAHIVARRRFEYLSHMWHGWNDANVVKALRRFCDRSGAYLIVKSRQKTPVPRYLEAVADRCLYDETHYPATVLEALSIASLSVSYYSNSVFESVALGVPHLCVTFSAEDYNGGATHYFSSFYTPEEGSPFQFRGVSSAWSIAETLRRLRGMSVGDFAMDPEARTRYIEKFLTHDARDGGARTIVAIEDALRRSGAQTRRALV